MATKKLTLQMDEALIEEAKEIARQSGKSLSQLVADYFRELSVASRPHTSPRTGLPPIVKSLSGVLRGHGVDEADYRRDLREKYR